MLHKILGWSILHHLNLSWSSLHQLIVPLCIISENLPELNFCMFWLLYLKFRFVWKLIDECLAERWIMRCSISLYTILGVLGISSKSNVSMQLLYVVETTYETKEYEKHSLKLSESFSIKHSRQWFQRRHTCSQSQYGLLSWFDMIV